MKNDSLDSISIEQTAEKNPAILNDIFSGIIKKSNIQVRFCVVAAWIVWHKPKSTNAIPINEKWTKMKNISQLLI